MRGQLLLNLHDASLQRAVVPPEAEELFVAASVPGAAGRAQSKPVHINAGAEPRAEWHQQISLDSSPASNCVEVFVYGRGRQGDELLASGSYSLSHVFDVDDEVRIDCSCTGAACMCC